MTAMLVSSNVETPRMLEAVTTATDVPVRAEPRAVVRVRDADVDAARALSREAQVAPAIAQVLLHRGLAAPDAARAFLTPRLADLAKPDAMADRAVAADRLARAVRAGERICVFGDYDVDGTTSAALMAETLTALGGDVVALLASRFAGGYGLSDAALDRVLETGAKVLVTCDCGSSDHARLARARAAGLDAIVVDHHLVPPEPLPVVAFLNPHRPDCGFPFKHLTSAGLAFYLAAAVRTALGATLDLRPYLDLVALGAVADVADLGGDHRALVRAGLALLSRAADGEGRPGLVALAEIAKLRGQVSAIDIAFRLAPRLNAAGRLSDPALSLGLLRARTLDAARAHAAALEAVNLERKRVEAAVTRAALAQALDVYGPSPRVGVVVADPTWHRGVVGITAARLVDRLGVPVIVVGEGEDGVGHGSARTPDGFRLYDAIAKAREALEGFGGHQAAAGVRMRFARLEALRAGFASATAGVLALGGDVPFVADLALDGETFRTPVAPDLARLEPLGAGNPEPLALVPEARVERAELVGERHLKLTLRTGGDVLDAFGWDLGAELARVGRTASVLGALRPDPWRGPRAVGLRIVAVDPALVS